MKSLSRAASLFLDALIIALILTWLAGGIPWHGHLLLKHGADPRRAAVLLTLLAAWLSSRTRHKSRVIFFVSRIHGLLLQSRWRWGILGVTFLGSVAVSIAQTLALRYPLYDVGLFHQILWSLANGHAFASSISKAGDFLQDHLSPSLALLTPFFWISQSSPLTLAFLHSSLIFGGVAAWVYLAERLSGLTESKRNQLAAATLIFSLSFESLWGNLRWGFHENSIYFCSFSWAIAFLILENIPPILLLLLFLVAAASKEILLLNCALALGTWAYFEKKRPFSRVLVGVAGTLVLVFIGYEKMPHPADKNYFDRYYAYLGRDLGTFLKNVLLTPWKIVQTVGALEILGYLKTVLLPWLALPLLMARSLGIKGFLLLAILPSMASQLLATYPPLRQPHIHYVLELWPVMAGLTLLAFSKIRSPHWLKIYWAWAILGMLWMDQDPWNQYWEYQREATSLAPVRARLKEIPMNASIAADELAGPWVAGRLKAVRLQDIGLLPGGCADEVVYRSDSPPDLLPLGAGCVYSLNWTARGWNIYFFRSSSSAQKGPTSQILFSH